jgi:hypothetical protein
MRRRLHPLLLVTGSRECDYDPVVAVLDDTLKEIIGSYGPPFVMHGGARGADQIAHMWASEKAATREVAWVERFPAHWAVYGKGAGPIRNAAMAERIWPHQEAGGLVIVLAFPKGESRGTRDMISAAEAVGINDIRTYEQELAA